MDRKTNSVEKVKVIEIFSHLTIEAKILFVGIIIDSESRYSYHVGNFNLSLLFYFQTQK